jgi:SAM-dependent methyltransferase
MVAFVSLKREAIQRAVRDMYTAVAEAPQQRFHFPTGRAACEALGYPHDVLDDLPRTALESFAGVGYPFAAEAIRAGDHVLDLGSGSGTDALICARLVGPRGRVYGLDITPGMREKLRSTAAERGVANLEILEGDAEAIPLPDACVDVVTSNGVLNLVPDKPRAFAEIHRVLKPGGRLQIADIALARPVAARYRQDPKMWAECVVGAVEEDRYIEMLQAAGFHGVERIRSLDYFDLSSNETTREVARLFNAHSVSLRAGKPAADEAITVPARGAVMRLAGELAGMGGAIVAWMACAGMPALVATFGAVGAGAVAGHAYMFPAFAGTLGVSVWLLWRSARLREDRRPFWLGLVGAVFAVAMTWLTLAGIAPHASWWSYLGIATIGAASIWSFIDSRRPGNCRAEMIREARLRERPASLRIATSLAGIALAVGALYGLHVMTAALATG